FRSFDSLPLVIFQGDSNLFSYSFFSGNRLIGTQDLYFTPYLDGEPYQGEGLLKVAEGDSLSLAFRAYPNGPGQGGYLELSYQFGRDPFMFGHHVALKGMGSYLDGTANYLTLDWMARLQQQEKSLKNERSTSTVYYKHLEDEVDYLSERSDKEESIPTRLKWVAFKQQFFSTVLIADQHFLNAELATQTEPLGGRYLRTMSASLSLPLEDADQSEIGMKVYLGPNKYSRLNKYKDLEMEDMIPLGGTFLSWINKWAVIPVFDFLETRMGNYGIIILVLTLLLKLVLFPLSYKSYLSSAQMRVLKPEVDEIGKKFPDQKDAMKKQQATMDLYRKAGVNPMAGCVPMLLQLPILIALFRFFPASIELRQQAFLWADDLSTYDSILDLPFNIPFYGDHVSLFTLLMTISTLIYTRINNQMMSTGNQLPGMKTMMYLMPIMFLGFFNSYSSGLSYYYFLANMITFGQMYIFRQVIDEDKLRAKIELNKKKPRKKSAFQRRLEEMQKQQKQQRRR
ncbi:MAG TPA: membrane protein insertase YidC, partial [Bacteroidales bacterium]|nr:membrane protein insertase YidC [Bacteroidales bacterium]